MTTVRRIFLLAFLLVSLLWLGGCTYVCHRYERFEDPVAHSGWTVEGRIVRWYAEDRVPKGLSMPHWGARDDDRYWLALVPLAPDTAFWNEGAVDLADVRVIADDDTIAISWDQRIGVREKPKHFYDGWREGFETASERFVSGTFHLSKPVPDVLIVEYELRIIDAATERILERWRMRSRAPIDRHRRWVIVDGIES
jgi:hypothetical protein